MKTLVVVSHENPAVRGNGRRDSSPERRHNQRRMGVARRVVPDRREDDRAGAASFVRSTVERRASGNRRRLQDRRIGLSKDLDLYLLGI